MSNPIANVLFTIYDPETGRVLRTGSVRPVDENAQAREGEAILKGVRAEPDEEVQFIEERKEPDEGESKGDSKEGEAVLVPVLTTRAKATDEPIQRT